MVLCCLGLVVVLLPSYISKKQSAPDAGLPAITAKVQLISDGLHSPTSVTFPGNGDVWVTEQTGFIRVIKNGKLLTDPLLDLRSKMIKVNGGYEERGLLSIALHPKFKFNKKFYVFYSAPATAGLDHKGVVAEYQLTAKGTVDPNSGRVILSIDEPEGNHNGGCIQFGHDGYLYISSGDGGGQGDKHGEFGNGQNMNTWLGKILRVNINTKAGYLVPKSNPFVGKIGYKPEIWAYGFRNPYRFSFDKLTGQLFAGDVGQDLWEEVNIIKKGANYGWKIVEGTHCYSPATGCDIKGITMPITEYSHKEGISVIGGYVYNGVQLPALKGKYLFADWIGQVYYLKNTGKAWQRGNITLQNIPPNLKVLAFGEDEAGEVYVLTNADIGPANPKGAIYKMVRN
ncbi:glucose dehydrogenase [Mucilaginibacter gilvus]|uniref:Glucose dehydrogenase n=2 Tax=Mucilaginibacter gilvus TaxID=2305909 RepID=A0A444MRY7_9SPHI|nr:glucose dehydrogenase [Mucilaginibacter gilvus]